MSAGRVLCMSVCVCVTVFRIPHTHTRTHVHTSQLTLKKRLEETSEDELRDCLSHRSHSTRSLWGKCFSLKGPFSDHFNKTIIKIVLQTQINTAINNKHAVLLS